MNMSEMFLNLLDLFVSGVKKCQKIDSCVKCQKMDVIMSENGWYNVTEY